jgi:uncharacterized membrane protein
MSSADFQKKIDELQSHLSSTSKMAGKEKCLPTLLIIGAVAPLVVFLTLYFLQPSFVQKKEGTKYTRSGPKVFYWTLGVTLAMWVCLYLFSFCSNKDIAMLCSRR